MVMENPRTYSVCVGKLRTPTPVIGNTFRNVLERVIPTPKLLRLKLLTNLAQPPETTPPNNKRDSPM